MILRPRQEVFVENCLTALKEHGAAIGVAPTGAGKTVMLSAVARKYKRPLILQHRDELVSQNRNTFMKLNPGTRTDLFVADRKAWSPGATFAMVQTLANHLDSIPEGMDIMLVDECFPSGTLVDGKPIELIRIGEEVSTHLGKGKVCHLFKKKPSSLVSVLLHGGVRLTCTEEHPIFTQDGFKPAKDLICGDMVVSIMPHEELHHLSEGNASSKIQKLQTKKDLREQGVQVGIVQTDDSKHVCKTRWTDHQVQNKQWDAQPRSPGVGFNKAQGNGMEASNTWGEWEGCNSPSNGSGFCIGVGDGGCDSNQSSKIRASLSGLLQGGYWERCAQGGGRSGWEFTSDDREEGEGQKEGRLFEFHRVDGVEVHEQTSCGTFGGLCPDGFVYNLEVENGNTYFANGFLVHNCHHAAAASYRNIATQFLERNPKAHILGLTATPQRSDKRALVEMFPVVADVIQLGELVQGGFLVRPRGYTIDLGIKAQIDRIPRTSDFDMDEVEKVMDHRPINEQVVREWKREAGDRQTVVFCSTVAHAEHLCEVFVENGIRAITIDGKMGKRDRKDIIDAFDAGRYQVILNCMVLTEGWDCQPVSCVVLMRPCSAKGPMLQMVGRGLRKLDQNRYPGQVKSDCKILDFGYSLVSHGDLETHINLAPQQRETGEAQLKQCPGCGIDVPNRTMECPVCGYEWQSKEKTVEHFDDIRLTEIQLMDASPFRWEEFFDGMVWLANGMAAWASVIEFGGAFWAVGGTESQKGVTVIDRTTEKVAAVASADDFLRQHGDTSLCKKTRSWLSLPPTDKQLQMLPGKNAFSMSRYTASCLLTWKFNESKIKVALTSRN